MSTNDLKNLAHDKMVETMNLLKSAHEPAEMEAANAEAKACYAADLLACYECVYCVSEGDPFFEAEMDAAQEAYNEAQYEADRFRYEADQIDNAMTALRNALDAIENTWNFEEMGR